MPLEITVDEDLLVLSGRLDAAGAITLDSWKADAATVPAIWDLRALGFLSSLGIRSLITLDRRVRAAGQRVQVVYVAESFVADVLTAAGLTKQWSMHTEVVSARAAGHSVASPTPSAMWTGAGGDRYARTTARGAGRVSRFQTASDAPMMLVRFDELGLAFGMGEFGTGTAHEPASALVSTGHTVLVRTADGLTDLLDTVSPATTFARIADAVRLELDDAQRWDAEGDVTWGRLRADLKAQAATDGTAPWAAGVLAIWDDRPCVLCVFAPEGEPLRVIALRAMADPGSEPHASGATTLAEAAAALAHGDEAEICWPDDATALRGVRVWFAPTPSIVDGGAQRLVIEASEPVGDAWERIIRSTFADEARVSLRRLTGGFMASTFATDTHDRHGRRTLPSVLKISPRAVTAREEAAYRQYVRPFILNNATVLMAQAVHGEFAGLRYNFLGITGAESRLQPLESLYVGDTPAEAMTAIRQTLTNVLRPWYGQAAVAPVQPFADHDPRGLFTDLPAVAQEVLGIDLDAPHIECPPLGRRVLNPYHFLQHRWDALRGYTASWATSITHGDLNLNNVLVDERRNIYVIDFSETRVRNVAADFARLEAICLLEHTRLDHDGDPRALLTQLERSLAGDVWTPPAAEVSAEPMLARAAALAVDVRGLATQYVADRAHEAAYLLPLLEWSLPIVAFRQVEHIRKQVAAWSSGLILERVVRTLDDQARDTLLGGPAREVRS
jgi:anti-anti-sigma regulatory factor